MAEILVFTVEIGGDCHKWQWKLCYCLQYYSNL